MNLKIINNKLYFDVYHKPKNYFSYLYYKSCHPLYTKNNIALSLGRSIVQIVADNKNNRHRELQDYLLIRKHLEKIIDYFFKKSFQSRKQGNSGKMLLPSLEFRI